LHVM